MPEASTNPYFQTIKRKLIDHQVVLFLGSGVNKGCTNQEGLDAPDGEELAQLIKEKFFANEDVPMDLPTICACTETRCSRPELDRFIYDLLIDYSPADSVLEKIPNFVWRRIYTTNFDRLLEAAYDQATDRKQTLRPI